MMKRICRVRTFGVEYSHGGRHFFVGNVVVADDKVYVETFGISNFVDSLDSAVEYYYQFYPRFFGIVYPFAAYTVSLVLPVGDILFDI